MTNYTLLDTEAIPQCCGSCEHVRYSHKLVYCDFTEFVLDAAVCVFGCCDDYKRKGVVG